MDWWPFAWVAFAPALIALHDGYRRHGMRRACLIGGTFGFLSGAGKVYWITETVVSYGGLDWILGLFSMAIVALLVGSYTFIFCVYAARADWRRAAFPFLAAGLWTALEYLQTYLFTGFPWELLGYSQYRVLPLIQIARVTGVYGVGFLVVLVNVALAMCLLAAREGLPWKPPIRALGLACLALVGTAGYGWLTLSRMRSLEGQTPPVRVAVVQGSIEQGMKWSEAKLQHTVDTYATLTRSALKHRPELVVFPETAMTFYLESPVYKPFAHQVHQLTEEAGVPLLTGALGYKPGENRVIYNSAFLLAPKSGVVGRYSKMHLVPFGEYLPMSSIFFWLKGLTDDIGVLTPGSELAVMPLPGLEMRLGTVICYESIFPDLVRQFVVNGANVLVVMTNDAWFGVSSAPMQHFSMAVLRAVENGVPVIRAANTGISGYIAATGRIYGMTPLLAATTTVGEVYPGRGAPTPYTRYGDVFALACCLVALAAVITVNR
jgi:apolipoprotein N-acyltransferase